MAGSFKENAIPLISLELIVPVFRVLDWTELLFKAAFCMSFLGMVSIEVSRGRNKSNKADKRMLNMRAALYARPKRSRVWLSGVSRP